MHHFDRWHHALGGEGRLDDARYTGRRAMLRTPLCNLLEIEVSIVQAAIWPVTAPELVAAVCEAGGLGSIGSVFESAENIQKLDSGTRVMVAGAMDEYYARLLNLL